MRHTSDSRSHAIVAVEQIPVAIGVVVGAANGRIEWIQHAFDHGRLAERRPRRTYKNM